jgi:hypothetical protein
VLNVQLFDPDRVDAVRCIPTTGYGLSAYTRGYSCPKPYGLMEFFCFTHGQAQLDRATLRKSNCYGLIQITLGTRRIFDEIYEVFS